MIQITVTIEEGHKKKLLTLSKKEKSSISYAVRKVLDKYFEKD